MTSTTNISQWSSTQPSNPGNELTGYARVPGFDETKRTLKPVYKIGSLHLGEFDSMWIYVKASAAVAANTACVLTTAGNVFTIAAGAGSVTSKTAFPINTYGWIQKTTAVVTG